MPRHDLFVPLAIVQTVLITIHLFGLVNVYQLVVYLVEKSNVEEEAPPIGLLRTKLSAPAAAIPDTRESSAIFQKSRQVAPFPARKCLWLLHEYIPSAYEKDWVSNIQKYLGNVCGQANKEKDVIAAWVDGVTAYNQGSISHQTSAFSKFIFQNNCTGELTVDFIEPLAGLTRHPYFCLLGADWIINKDYLVVSWNVTRKAPAKSYYFDLGASLYNSGNGGPSQSWFIEMYERRGIIWDGIFSWEMQKLDPTDVWEGIPKYLKPVYHWYNIPTNPDEGHPDNPLEYIKRTANEEDFVLLKIDIDNAHVELAIVRQLMASDELMRLVDEFYFEHHVNVGVMQPYWGSGLPETLVDTYAIFNELRHKGIMAHSWV